MTLFSLLGCLHLYLFLTYYSLDHLGYLEGPAKATIAGLSLTGANYKCAVDLLKKRFDKKNEVQRAHINELIYLPAVYRERDTHRLRKLYDSCEAHNRVGIKRGSGITEAEKGIKHGKRDKTRKKG